MRKPNGCKNCKWDYLKKPVIPKTKRTCPACGAENTMWEPMTEEQIKNSKSTIREFSGNRKKVEGNDQTTK